MKTNMGTMDKAIRIGVAVIILIGYFTGVINGVTATVLLVIAAAFILTSLIGVCPVYYPFGWNTKKNK